MSVNRSRAELLEIAVYEKLVAAGIVVNSRTVNVHGDTVTDTPLLVRPDRALAGGFPLVEVGLAVSNQTVDTTDTVVDQLAVPIGIWDANQDLRSGANAVRAVRDKVAAALSTNWPGCSVLHVSGPELVGGKLVRLQVSMQVLESVTATGAEF